MYNPRTAWDVLAALKKHTGHEDIVGAEAELHVFLTSTLDGSEWSASRSGPFTTGTNWIGGLMGPRRSLDTAVAKRNNPHHCSYRDPKPGRPVRSVVSILKPW
jgi:hypothetical protein